MSRRAPSTLITSAITFWRWLMYLLHICGVTVLQNVLLPSFSSGILLGLCLFLRKFFIDPHTFSIGFKSGLSARLFHQCILFFSKKAWIYRLVCFGSLSWYSLWPSGYILLRNGMRKADISISGCCHYSSKHHKLSGAPLRNSSPDTNLWGILTLVLQLLRSILFSKRHPSVAF